MSYIVQIEIEYTVSKRIKTEFSPELYAEFREEFADFDLPENQSDMSDWSGLSMFGSEKDFWRLTDLGLEPRAKRIRGMPAESVPPEAKEHLRQEDRVQIINVSVPNAALFAVQKITWVEDACTQHIQKMLDEDWRIVAVVPANDTRRPTYIMGHFNKDAVA